MGEEYEQVTRSNIEHQTIVNVLELLDAEPTLRAIFQGMSRWEMATVNGSQQMWRQHKPDWSDDFCIEIINFLRFNSNIIHSQTELDGDYIPLQMRETLIAKNHDICITGRDHYITDAMWVNIRKDWENEKKNWHIEPISRTLLARYRNPHDLGAFVSVWRVLVMNMQTFVKSSLNRGKDALTLDYLQARQDTKVTNVEKKNKLGFMKLGGNQNVT